VEAYPRRVGFFGRRSKHATAEILGIQRRPAKRRKHEVLVACPLRQAAALSQLMDERGVEGYVAATVA